MGSSARHSNGRKATRRHARKGKRSPAQRKSPQSSPPDFDAILGRFSDALSLIATATNALVRAQERSGTLAPQDAGEELFTLEHGVRALRSVYNELDNAILEVRP